mgnify:CR=1 FL=1
MAKKALSARCGSLLCAQRLVNEPHAGGCGTIKVDGMMCGHCEARVKKALEELKGIAEAVPDHNTGEVLLKFTKDPGNAKLAKAVEKAGYTMSC